MSTDAAVTACAICDKPVPLEIAKADEDGQSVHEQCYVLKLMREAMTEPVAWKWWKGSAAMP